MMKQNPNFQQNFSVVVPAYQAESFIERTLSTVADQTIQPHELIVVDDGSTDGTVGVVESFALKHPQLNVRVLREPHRGPGATRNAGIRAARSEWVAFLDSDDLWLPEKLEKMMGAVQTIPSANFHCHNETIRYLDGTMRLVDYSVGFSFATPISRQLYLDNYFSTSAVVCRRDLLLRWNGFDEDLLSAQDYELWLRMSPELIPNFVACVLGEYVLRDGNITTSRYWKRLGNILRVKCRHWRKGGLALFCYSVLRVSFYHAASPIYAYVKKIVGRLVDRN